MRALYDCIKKEKSQADEMFEKLGWKKNDEYSNCFWLENKEKTRITFWKHDKKISANGDFTIPELQAINKKCKELGWLE